MAKHASSATNVRAISFAENRTFRAFVLLYAVMSLFILGLLGAMDYRYKYEEMLSQQRLSMQLEGESYLPRLVAWMQGDRTVFPEDPAYETAFYVGDRRIGGKLHARPDDLTPGMHKKGDALYLVIPMGSYGLKEGKTVMMTVDDGLWRREFVQTALLAGSGLFVLLLLIGLGLSKLFLRPMKSAVELLDRFIRDTTHELNTPVTAIVTNIERLDTGCLEAAQRKKIERIETAARTIETLYNDLTYLLLHHDVARRDIMIDLETLLRERLEVFHSRCEMKRLHIDFSIEASAEVRMDRTAAVRLTDNLLSNAVKYSDVGGTIRIVLYRDGFGIANGGAVIAAEEIGGIFGRYRRADESRGGFGIGLSIVARIAKEYAIRIEVSSREGQTRFRLIWPRYTPRPS